MRTSASSAPATLSLAPGSGVALALACALTLAGCAEPTRVAQGTPGSEVLRRLGAPTARYALGTGERLQYSRAPAGTEVTNIDLDPAGRVAAVTQVLDERRFALDIRPGVWRADDVLRTYGAPENVTRVASFDGSVWSWRYRAYNAPRLLHVYLDPQGVVRRWHSADDLRYDPPNSRE